MSENNRALIPFTNEHFAAFCIKMIGGPYWYGCCLYKCSAGTLSGKTRQYPSHYGSNRTARYQQDIAAKKVAADCIGAVKGYMWTGGGQGVLEAIGTNKTYASKYGSNGCPDKGANSMFSYAKGKGMDWGAIGTLPEIVGLALHKSGHIGYYIGNGYAVEWRGFNYGCVKTKVAGRGWQYWYKLPFILYGAAVADTPDEPDTPITPDTPTTPDMPVQSTRNLYYKSGSMMRGDDVRTLQKQLNSLDFNCGTADGIFGAKTRTGVKTFQAAKKLEVDGIVGPKTYAALAAALQPVAQSTGAASVEAESEQDEHAQSQTEAGAEQDAQVTKPAPEAQPVTVRIKMTREENITVYGTDEVSINIEDYLRGVVPSEMYESANIEALKAQAICARTYAYYRRNSVLSDTPKHQSFHVKKIGNNPRSDEAIASTRGMVLTYGGKLVNCFYCASNKGITKRSGDVWSTHYPYYVSKTDEWDEAAREESNVTSFGHGIGMSQHGAMWAARHGVSHQAILAFYYEGSVISRNYGLNG